MTITNIIRFSRILRLSIASTIFVVTLVSCFAPAELEPTQTSDPIVCPTINPPSLPQFKSSPAFLFVLVEGTPSHQDHTLRLLNDFSDSLPHILEPGDRLVIALMEPQTLETSVIVNIKSTPLPPPILPTQLPPPPTVEFVTITARQPQSRIAQDVATRNAEMTREAFDVTATQIAKDYNCGVYEWGTQYQNAINDWNDTHSNAVNELVARADQGINNVNPDNFEETTRVFEALSLTSLTFKEECPKYEACSLLIFSDLSEWRYDRPNDIEVNLSNVDVLVILSDCTFLYQENCTDRVDRWTSHFRAYQAQNIRFDTSENGEEAIKSFLRR